MKSEVQGSVLTSCENCPDDTKLTPESNAVFNNFISCGIRARGEISSRVETGSGPSLDVCAAR